MGFLRKRKLYVNSVGNLPSFLFWQQLSLEWKDDNLVYLDHLKQLHNDTEVCFCDLLDVDIAA